MSVVGYERTLSHTLNYFRFTPESGHSERGRKESAYDPKRTLTGVRRRYVWRSIFKIDEAQFMIAAGRIALYAFHL